MRPLTDYAKLITDPMFDVCGSTKLTPGQTLTVLKMARHTLDVEIAHWEETIERQTATTDQQAAQPEQK